MKLDIDSIRQFLRIAVAINWGISDNDIIIDGHMCTVSVQDPIAQKAGAVPDLIIKINTSDVKLQDHAEQLRDYIVKNWKIFFGDTYPKMEVWIDFFHTWGCTIEFEK